MPAVQSTQTAKSAMALYVQSVTPGLTSRIYAKGLVGRVYNTKKEENVTLSFFALWTLICKYRQFTKCMQSSNLGHVARKYQEPTAAPLCCAHKLLMYRGNGNGKQKHEHDVCSVRRHNSMIIRTLIHASTIYRHVIN